MQKKLLFMIICSITAVLLWQFSKATRQYELERLDIYASKLVPENIALEAKLIKSPIPHLLLTCKNDKQNISFIFSTVDAGVACHGYRNIVELLVLTDGNGKIISLFFGKNRETKNIVEKIRKSAFLKFWAGKNYYSAYQPAITGATFTCNSINNSLEKLFNEIEKKKFFDKYKQNTY